MSIPPNARSTRVTAGLKWAPEAGPEGQDQRHQDAGRGGGVLEQLEARIVGEALGHDPGADHAAAAGGRAGFR